MIPLIPLQFDSFKTNLTMEQAISILGRSLHLKREARNYGEVVSFKYAPPNPIQYSQAGAGIVVYIKYHSEHDGLGVSVAIMPSILIMFFFIFGFGLPIVFGVNFSIAVRFFLIFMFFYLFLWWESIETKRAIRNMFRDWIIKEKE